MYTIHVYFFGSLYLDRVVSNHIPHNCVLFLFCRSLFEKNGLFPDCIFLDWRISLYEDRDQPWKLHTKSEESSKILCTTYTYVGVFETAIAKALNFPEKKTGYSETK